MPHLTRHIPQRLDADTPAPAVRMDTAREMRNMRVSQEGRQIANGTRIIDGGPVVGTSIVVGKATDPATNLVYLFRYVASGAHTISAYTPDANIETVVLTWAGLGFTATTQVRAWVIAGALNWLDGVQPVRSLPLDNLLAYQTAIGADPATDYLTLNRLPPLRPLTAVGFYDLDVLVNRLLYASLQFSYLYEYADGQRSVLAPWSKLVPMRHTSPPSVLFDNSIDLTVPTGAGRPGALVVAVHFYVRKGNDGIANRFFTENNPAQYAPGDTWTVTTTYDTLAEALTSADATRAFDALPTGPPQAGASISNRNFLANFSDGYAAPAGLSLEVTPVVEAGAEGARVWRGGETIRVGLVAYDAFGRNVGVLPDTVVTVTIPVFDFATVTPMTVVRLDCVIAAASPLPAWVARIDVVRTDKPDTPFFVQGVGRLTYQYAYTNSGTEVDDFFSFPLLGPSALPPTPGYSVYFIPKKAIWLDIASLPLRERGYVYTPGDLVNLAYRNPYAAGDATILARGIPVVEQRGDLLRLDVPSALLAQYDVLPTADAGSARAGADLTLVLNDSVLPDDSQTLPDSSALYGVVFEIYTPSNVSQSVFYEVAATIPVAGGVLAATTISLTGDVFLKAAPAAPPVSYPKWSHPLLTYETEQPDSGSLTAANTLYWRWLFNTSPSDRYPAWETDRGRPQADLGPRLRQVRRLETGIIFSGKILPESGINTLNVFEATALDVLPVEYGAVTALAVGSDAQATAAVLLAIHTHQTESLQIEQAILRSTDGGFVSTATSDQVIASKSLLAGGYGSVDPLSVVERGGRVFFFCREKGEWVRYAQNGLTPLAITYQLRTVFRAWEQAATTYGFTGRVVGGYDGYASEAVLRLPRILDATGTIVINPGFTLGYSERQQGFTSYYDYAPENLIDLPDGLASAYAGQVWRHHTGLPATFYGVVYPAVVRFVVPTQQAATPVLWQSIVIESDAPWLPVLLTNERGQRSTVLRGWLKQDRDMWKTAIRGDGGAGLVLARLLNGPPLRSLTLEVTLSVTLGFDDVKGPLPLGRLDAVDVKGAQDVTPLQQ